MIKLQAPVDIADWQAVASQKRRSAVCGRFDLSIDTPAPLSHPPDMKRSILLFNLLAAAAFATSAAFAHPWPRHTIDESSRGADGIRTADINGDGLLDLTTGWEEGGVVRVYLNPGPQAATQPWPAVTVGHVRSPEDAVFADIDGDGASDVVSSCEGKTRQIFIHWSPATPANLLEAAAWQTEPLPAADNGQQWMYAQPLQIDGQFGVDLIIGSKGNNASIGWLQSPADPRQTDAWTYHRLCDAGWIMSLIPHDMDGDGDQDMLASDRRGPGRGVFWLENPGATEAARGGRWPKHVLGAADREVMFLDLGAPAGHAPGSVVAACKDAEIVVLTRPKQQPTMAWQCTTIPFPSGCGQAKAAATADIDLDGHADIVFTCEAATKQFSGVRWLSRNRAGGWDDHEVSGPEGVKFDRIELIDCDHDGDLDILTCEERSNLGVIWYENPTRSPNDAETGLIDTPPHHQTYTNQ